MLATRRTRFGRLTVTERDDGVRVIDEDGQPMSAWDPSDPERLIYPYQHLLAAASALRAPGRALVVGVAGGTFLRWLARAGWNAEGVEINRRILALSERWLGLDPSLPIHVADGRAWLDRNDGPWDLIVLDACSEHYIPPSLATLEWYTRVRAVLAPGGVVVQNAWARAPRADDELATWRAAFGDGWILDDPSETATENRALLHVDGPDPRIAGPLRLVPMPATTGTVRSDPA